MPVVLLSASALALGFLHGLGVDHLMAIAALSVDGRAPARQTRAVRTAFQFACGHTIMLGVGVLLAVAFGWILPAAFAAGAERVGGALLVLLGIAGVWTTVSGRAYGHVHASAGGDPRWHVHFGGRAAHPLQRHPESIVPIAMGAAFAVSSLRAFVMLAPMGTSMEALAVPVLLLLVLLFGLGILLSMSLFGVVLARVLSLHRLQTLGRAAGLIVAGASALLGAYWMLR